MQDGGPWAEWIGRVEEAEDSVPPQTARALAATLDMDAAARDAAGVAADGPLPPLWHWLAFLPDAPMSALDADGHPRRGGFLPPVPLERRMWASGRLRFHGELRIGEPIHRRSEIVRVSEKTGSTGRMVFVSVAHELSTTRGLAVSETQDIVYMPMPERFAPPAPTPAPAAPAWSEAVAMDTARLFRFSAVTFNAHRIHYDLAYATGVERYPGLVVHGPLQAILLMEAARRRRGGAWPVAYAFRGVRPLFHHDALRLAGEPEADGGQDLCTVALPPAGADAGPDAAAGYVCMQARVTWDV
jgi:3-methylfumaryl-CoA hydratase